ncbi:DNA internalization-related competence protein ComEC/Rec2 [Uliginosibacterium gangwonense]|uniref:DNA internalization-related competence protein ComEC/Rec2 n=1 Tax=Uliginosibacterium gangwonense TaxID=392736 RepID=UPI00037E4E46|nr:DNA internalization-related competence protein ComEC/Rec2 [Uliginosibacterium gangwonense]
MELAIVGFALGVWLCQTQTTLLGVWAGMFVLGVMVLAVAAWRLHGGWRAAALFALGVLLGFAQANWRAQIRLAERLDSVREMQEFELAGRIDDLPQHFDQGERFFFIPIKAPAGIPEKIQVSWYRQGKTRLAALPAPRAGEVWRFALRLRQPHGNLNPHGFDYEAWAFERDIGAIGVVCPSAANTRLSEGPEGFWGWVDHLRERVRDRFVAVLPDSPWRGVLLALSVGDQASIPTAQWQLFARVGITHLVSISGLHVTMMGAVAGWLLAAIWRRVPWLVLRLPVQKVRLLAASAGAGFYVLLAGCGVPAQRTFYMLAVAALALWLGRGMRARRILLLALWVVLLIDPWASFSAGFWLSFMAVAALLLMDAAGEGGAWWREWGRAQWAVSLFTLPVLLGLFQQFSLISPLANAVAIPAISMVIAPLALLFAALPLPSLAELANWLLGWLMSFLQWLSAAPFAVWQQAAPPWWLVLAASVGAAWALMPRGVPARYVGLLCFIPLVAWQAPHPPEGQAQITILDVGQGLAVHVQTAHHDLLYDTGPKYAADLDAGMRVVLPYLRAEGVGSLDMLVVSHDDSDHSGGASSILTGMPVQTLRSSLSPDHPLLTKAKQHALCTRGQTWAWDGVRFEFLHPTQDWASRGDNDSSCVLRVSTTGASLLLTGDIEMDAEQRLLADVAASLPSSILVAPHHGSKSSSHADFIAATRPREVVFSNGYLNRFHHPAPEVVSRYQAAGVHMVRSDEAGAIRYRLLSQGYIGPFLERAEAARYWQDH